jgi:hypothetical protein
MIEIISIHIPKTAGRTFRDILYQVYGTEQFAYFHRTNYTDLKNLSRKEQFLQQLSPNQKIIHGHFRFPEIQHIYQKNNCKLITWLREPVERVISNYCFFKRRILENPNDENLQKRKHETLMEYAKLEECRNLMCQFLQGVELEHFFFIGFVESYDEDIQKLSKMLNWGDVSIPRVNDIALLETGMGNGQ